MAEVKSPASEEAPATSSDVTRSGEELRLIGTPFRRVDGRAKVTGQTKFADDLNFPRMVHMKLVRSTVPHGRIVSIDTSEAEKMPGVLGVLTGESMPIPFGILPVSQDEHALCVDKVRFVGDPVVAIAALTEDQAYEASLQVQIEYEAEPTISSVDEALKIPEPRIHEYGDEGNLHKKLSMEFGDTESGFAEADEVFEDVLFFEGNTHLPMEQHATVALTEETDRVIQSKEKYSKV